MRAIITIRYWDANGDEHIVRCFNEWHAMQTEDALDCEGLSNERIEE